MTLRSQFETENIKQYKQEIKIKTLLVLCDHPAFFSNKWFALVYFRSGESNGNY